MNQGAFAHSTRSLHYEYLRRRGSTDPHKLFIAQNPVFDRREYLIPYFFAPYKFLGRGSEGCHALLSLADLLEGESSSWPLSLLRLDPRSIFLVASKEKGVIDLSQASPFLPPAVIILV